MKKSAETRQRILDAAAAAFALKGYGRTLMSDIAEGAGIHIAGLYYHFDTKDDLVEAMINNVLRIVSDHIADRVTALPPGTLFSEKLRVAIHAHLEVIVARRDYILAQSKVLSELPEDRQENHRVRLHEAAEFWRRLLREGRKAQALRSDVDLSIARMILHGSVNWAIEWYRPGGRSVQEIADQIADTMLNGIALAD